MRRKSPPSDHDSEKIMSHNSFGYSKGFEKREGRLPTLEALFIKEIVPVLNKKDEYRGRTLSLKI